MGPEPCVQAVLEHFETGLDTHSACVIASRLMTESRRLLGLEGAGWSQSVLSR